LYRVFADVKSTPWSPAFLAARANLKHLLGDFLLEAKPGDGCPMSLWDWIKSMPSRCRKALVRALKDREERGEPSSQYNEIHPFVKSENLAKFGVKNGVYSVCYTEYVARLIQAPHDETHLDAGRYLKPLVPRLKEQWSWESPIFYASVAPEKLDKWLNRVCGAQSFFWADYSSFDATYSHEAWMLIESLYAEIYPDAPPEFWAALSAWRCPKGKAKCRKEEVVITYQADAMNASGRDDTALANALFNGIALTMSLAAALAGVTVDQVTPGHIARAKEVFQVAVVGDDSLVACEVDVSGFAPAIVANLERFGLVVKAQCSPHLADVTFLGSMPYPVAGHFYWGPTIGRRLYKAFWQADPVGNLPAWTRGVAQQLMLYRCVPVLFEIAEKVFDYLSKTKITTAYVDPNRLWQTREAPVPHWDQSTLEWLCFRYRDQGLSVGMIRDDLRTVKSISRLPAMTRLNLTDASLLLDDM
jgi:hypothetical protein